MKYHIWTFLINYPVLVLTLSHSDTSMYLPIYLANSGSSQQSSDVTMSKEPSLSPTRTYHYIQPDFLHCFCTAPSVSPSVFGDREYKGGMYIWKLEDSLQVWVPAYHVGHGDQIRSPSLAASTFT